MKLNQIKDNPGSTKSRKRIGRGIGSGTGKTSGKGHKGQKSRSGVSIKSFEGGQMPLYRRLPKRGFKVIRKNDKIAVLNLDKIQKFIDKNKKDFKSPLDLKTLKEKKLISKKFLKLKILGTGEIKQNIDISAHFASKQALEKVQRAGGKLNIIKK